MHDYDILDLLVGIVAKMGHCKPKDLRELGRCPSLCKLRDTLLYLARQRTGLSFRELGEYFRWRHPTTIMSSVNNETIRLERNLRHASGQPLSEWHKMILQQLDTAIAEKLAAKQPPPPAPAAPERPEPPPPPTPQPPPTPEPDHDA